MKKPMMLGALIAALAINLSAIDAKAAAPTPVCAAGINELPHATILDEGTGPDIVLIPGLSTPRAVWNATAARLKGQYRLHIVQVRGFGDEAGANAEGPVLTPMMEDVTRYITTCITAQGRAAPTVIGHSMGGLTGLMIAARHPEALGKLMIVDALPFIGTMFNPAATVEMVKPQAEQMAAMMRAQYGKPTEAAPVTDPGPASMAGGMSNSVAGRTAIAGWTQGADARVTAQLFQDVMATDMRGELGTINAPVTLLYAQDDSALPAAAAKAAFEPQYAALAHLKAVMVTGSRHFIMLDQPEAFAAAVDGFLAD